ncbi:hypothetical protein BA059_09740 [Mycolicibacterium sp. (ex Dasyatis americana)]|uniref:hypothetical protein n=1 Tax=Mycobacterium sp. DBP42 TaxID=2545267 RepID=UPI0008730995|nr:hypothetical protein [Mycobacterium sp. DBP42]OFB40299.1 hypothetical protein BA059_09740 [Mycolicibacterium sp. (ex Dasyatis americana)]TMS48479.1 hypothetical protein E0T84_27185 [Mycobacterium sp. DBP42]
MTPAAACAPLPTRSEIEEWSTSHLSDAASGWRSEATASEDAFDQHRQNVSAPGGTTWEGGAKDAALDRVTADTAVVGRQSSVLRQAADLAENGSHDVAAAKGAAVEAISAAENDGFRVCEDLTVTDARKYDITTIVARNKALKEHAEDIRWAAEQLVQADKLVGDRLQAKATELGSIRFDGEGERMSVQAASFGSVPESPRFPLPEKPWEYNLDLTTDLKVSGGKSAGEGITVDDVWNELHRCFNCNFPMGGAPKEFPKVGDKLPLEIKMAGVKMANFPVEVTQAEKSGSEINIEFVTLPGHVDGPGSTIHFRFFEQGGEIHLGVNAHITDPGPGTQPPPVGPVLRGMYTGVAHLNWQPYIDRLADNIQQSHGVVPNTGPPVAPPGLPPIAVPNTGQR